MQLHPLRLTLKFLESHLQFSIYTLQPMADKTASEALHALPQQRMLCRGLGNMPGVGEDEDAAQPTYMPIVPAGMSTSAPAPQVTT